MVCAGVVSGWREVRTSRSRVAEKVQHGSLGAELDQLMTADRASRATCCALAGGPVTCEERRLGGKCR